MSRRYDIEELAGMLDAEIHTVAREFKGESPLRIRIIAALRIMDML